MKIKPITIFIILISFAFFIESLYFFGWKVIERRINERACEQTKNTIIEIIARGNQNYDEIKANLQKGLENICIKVAK